MGWRAGGLSLPSIDDLKAWKPSDRDVMLVAIDAALEHDQARANLVLTQLSRAGQTALARYNLTFSVDEMAAFLKLPVAKTQTQWLNLDLDGDAYNHDAYNQWFHAVLVAAGRTFEDFSLGLEQRGRGCELRTTRDGLLRPWARTASALWTITDDEEVEAETFGVFCGGKEGDNGRVTEAAARNAVILNLWRIPEHVGFRAIAAHFLSALS